MEKMRHIKTFNEYSNAELADLRDRVKELNPEGGGFFVVVVKEDNYDNTGDAIYRTEEKYDNLEDAFKAYKAEVKNIENIDYGCDYKEIALVLYSEDGDVIDDVLSSLYNNNYDKDHGKYLLCYFPKNNGVRIAKVELIDKSTKFISSDDSRYGLKTEIHDTKEDVIKAIYDKSLYISMDEAEEIFNDYIL